MRPYGAVARILRLAFTGFLVFEVVPKRFGWSDKMKHQRHFEYGNRSREALQTRTLIADIDRIVQILSGDIAAEEKQAGVFDRSRADYPMLARKLAARRDNLAGTIAALERQLADIPARKIVQAQEPTWH
jgi:septation ring formation regulator EzrA